MRTALGIRPTCRAWLISIACAFPVSVGSFGMTCQPSPKLLSVCQVIGDLQVQTGTTIALRGEVVLGDEHFAIKAETGCTKKFVTRGFTWPDAIWLVWDRSDDATRSSEKLKEVANRARAQRKRIRATFVGRLETREVYRMMQTAHGIRGYGFGHLASYPGQLVYTRIEDITTEER